jgi:hypothetical protein
LVEPDNTAMRSEGDMDEKNGWKPSWVIVLLPAALVAGCGSDGGSGGGDGNLSVLLRAEESIPGGLVAGTGDENILDGFDIDFSKYVISVGLVAMSQLGGANPQNSNAVAVADLTRLGTTPPELTTFNGIATGQYTEFGFQTPEPESGAINFNAEEGDFDAMIAHGWSHIVAGTITRVEDGATKDFRIEAHVPSVFTACAVEDLEPGVNVSTNSSVDITVHGDHIFFNGFPEEEGNVVRQARWLWDIEDTDDDSVVTKADFEAATDIGSLFPSPPTGNYELTGGPLPIRNAWDFVRAQLGTQGHIFGEGECEWSPLE